MIISFSPQYGDGELTLTKFGDVLTVNGDALDFSDLPEGGEYPSDAIDNPFVIGEVKRHDGAIRINILLPYSNPDAPISVTFPEKLLVTVDGVVPLPEGRFPLVEDLTDENNLTIDLQAEEANAAE